MKPIFCQMRIKTGKIPNINTAFYTSFVGFLIIIYKFYAFFTFKDKSIIDDKTMRSEIRKTFKK